MKIIKTLLPLLLSLNLIACATQQPVFTFALVPTSKENPTQYNLKRHPTSAITANPGQVLQLWMDNAYFTQLYDRTPIKEGYSGKREVLIYAIIYKDGFFQKFSKITDLANNMASYQPVVVQKPNFFTETMDGSSYQIVIKAFEVDTEGLVRILRRVNTTDINKIAGGTSAYAPGATFVAGFQDVLHGFFDMILSVTGKSVDDWVEQIAANKVFEHSIYVVPPTNPDKSNPDKTIKDIVLLASGDNGDSSDATKKLWTFKNSSEIYKKACHLPLDNTITEKLPLNEIVEKLPLPLDKKDCLKRTDYLVAESTKGNMKKVEKLDPLNLDNFNNGSFEGNSSDNITPYDLNFVSHISISIKRLPEN